MDAVGKFCEKFHLDQIVSDPHIVQSILQNELYLSDCEAATHLFNFENRGLAFSLTPMIDEIKRGVRRSPILIEVLERALAVISERPVDVATMARTVHYAYILEELTRNMAASRTFSENVAQHIREKARKLGVGATLPRYFGSVWRLSGSLFVAVKTTTIEFAMVRQDLARARGRFARALKLCP